MKTAATIQLVLIYLALMIGVLHSQPIPMGIFYNLNRGGTGAASGGGGACSGANGQLDFSTNCNTVYYFTLLL